MGYDLEERTATFGETILDFAKKIPLTRRIIGQLVGAGTNYCEADDAIGKKRVSRQNRDVQEERS